MEFLNFRESLTSLYTSTVNWNLATLFIQHVVYMHVCTMYSSWTKWSHLIQEQSISCKFWNYFFKCTTLFSCQCPVNSKNCLQGNLIVKSLGFSFWQFTWNINSWVIGTHEVQVHVTKIIIDSTVHVYTGIYPYPISCNMFKASTFPTIVVYVMDTSRSINPVTFMSNMLYACSIMYKAKLPFIVAMNKVIHFKQIKEHTVDS